MEKRTPQNNELYGPDLQEPGAQTISAVERLMNQFATHESQEAHFTKRYKEVFEKSKNPLVRFLFQLIITDEEKHHAVIHAMSLTLKGAISWTRPQDELTGFNELGAEKDELLKLTEEFVELEKTGIKEYKELIKASKSYYRGVFALLLGSMIHDSEKHAEILEFLVERLKEA
jgi:bacterioferritin (cytochrome b1)